MTLAYGTTVATSGTGAAKPKLGMEAVYGDASDDELPSREVGVIKKLKDAVTGQDPSHGIASGTATIGGPGIAGSGPQNSAVQDQDVGTGAPLPGNFGVLQDQETRHNPVSDQYVLDGQNAEEVDRLRNVVG